MERGLPRVVLNQAAKEIERLREEIKQLRSYKRGPQ
jgi:hypothetical protein